MITIASYAYNYSKYACTQYYIVSYTALFMAEK